MTRLHEHEDFNGVDVSLHKLDGDFLLIMQSEDGCETLSVWITREQLISFVNKLGEVDGAERLPAVFKDKNYIGSGVMAIHKIDPDINIAKYS